VNSAVLDGRESLTVISQCSVHLVSERYIALEVISLVTKMCDILKQKIAWGL